MLSQNIKHNLPGKVGEVSCLLLILLTFLAINPVIHSSAFAEEIPENETEEIPDDGISAQADTPSTVGISFSPASGSASLSPTTSAGQSAQIKVLATVSVQNSGGYSVYVKSNTQNLVGKNSSANVIPGISGAVTYDNLATNTWGYTANEGTAVPENATYKAVSVTGNGDKVAENTSNKILSDTKTIALSFAAKIGTDKPADTYENKVTLSVVSSPAQLTLLDIDNLQDMTTAICENTTQLATKQLKDVRDGKYYWVTKLADNNCWMTQNLDLDLSTNPDQNDAAANTIKTFSNVDTDLNSKTSWTPTSKTFGTVTSSTILADDTGQRSWNLGSYYINNPSDVVSCGGQKNNLADCAEYFNGLDAPTSANGDMNTHYLAGNYYQWNAATAGSGNTITSGEAEDSICPRGWRLPTSGSDGEFRTLMDAYGVASETNISGSDVKIVLAPLYFVRGGSVNQDGDSLFANANDNGFYWSSTPYSSSDMAYRLNFHGTITVDPSGIIHRRLGYSIRCLAR